MKFIQLEEVTKQLETRPELLSDPYITLVLKMMAWEKYVERSVAEYKIVEGQSNNNTRILQSWLDIARGINVFPIDTIPQVSNVLHVLLVYTILKHDDPQSSWSIHTGTYESPIIDPLYSMDIPYLQASPIDEMKSPAEMLFVGDEPVDQLTVISKLSENDLTNGALVMDDSPICVGSELLRYEPMYRTGSSKESVPLPNTKGELMKWARSEGILDDDNVDIVSKSVDQMLDRNTDFTIMIRSSNLWDERSKNINLYNVLLMRTILKIKVSRGMNIVFDHYPPDKCVVPTTTMEI